MGLGSHSAWSRKDVNVWLHGEDITSGDVNRFKIQLMYMGPGANGAFISDTIDINQVHATHADFNFVAGRGNAPDIIDINSGKMFDVNFVIPTDYNHIGKQITIMVTTLSGQPVGTTSIVAAPALIITPQFSGQDKNVSIRGYGFRQDENVSFKLADVNGNVNTWTDVNRLFDLNTGGADVHVWNSNNADTNAADGFKLTLEDLNGIFDVNGMVPRLSMFAMGNMDVNIMATGTTTGQVHAQLMAFPQFTMPSDMNVTVSICESDVNDTCWNNGTRYPIEEAMQKRLIANTERVKGMVVEIGDPIQVRVRFDSDMNLAKGPKRDYSSDMNNAEGKVGIDSQDMPEFADINAYITLFNIKSNGPAPTLAKNGVLCGGHCTNKVWTYSSTTGDGNMNFIVDGFSEFGTIWVDANITAPTGGERFDWYHQSDGNYAITFNYTDANNNDTPDAKIYYSDTNAGMKHHIVTMTDLNASCTNSDANQVTTNSCTYDWNLQFVPMGEWYVDINIIQDDLNWVSIHMDKNITVNAPVIQIIDTNFNSGYFDGNTHQDASGPFFSLGDVNYVLDFNILMPDGNYFGGPEYIMGLWLSPNQNLDGNHTLDYNILANPSQDLNVAKNCLDIDANPRTDNNCTMDINFLSLNNGTLTTPKGLYYLKIDTNIGTVASARPVTIGTHPPKVTFIDGWFASNYNWADVDGNFVFDFNISDLDDYDFNTAVVHNEADLSGDNNSFPNVKIYLDGTDNNQWNGKGTLYADLNFWDDINKAKTRIPALSCGDDLDRNFATDNNCTFQIDTSTWDDGNYWIHFDINDFHTRVTYTSQQIEIDNNAPVAVITSPSGSQIEGTTVTLSWTGNDAETFVKNYWVQIDSNNWTNMGTATSESWGSLSYTAHTFRVKAQSASDLNSTTLTKTINFVGSSGAVCGNGSCEAGETTSNCSADCGTGSPGGGDTTGGSDTSGDDDTGTTTDIITEAKKEYTATSDNIDNIIDEAGLGDIYRKAANVLKHTMNYGRTMTVTKTTDNETNAKSYETEIVLSVTNRTSIDLRNVKIVEKIPKEIAATASEITITGGTENRVLLEDPIIEFTIPTLKGGETFDVTYTVASNINEDAFNNYTSPIATLAATIQEGEDQEKECTTSDECNDNIECTEDLCIQGSCLNGALADGTVCSIGECIAGVCTAPEAPTTTAPPTEPVMDYTWLWVVIIVIIIIALAYYMMQLKKPENKLTFNGKKKK
ncbi:MAG: hypothetical protein ABH821_05780 [archaeon]